VVPSHVSPQGRQVAPIHGGIASYMARASGVHLAPAHGALWSPRVPRHPVPLGETVSLSNPIPSVASLGFSEAEDCGESSNQPPLNLSWVGRSFGWSGSFLSCWKGTVRGDRRSFAQVVRVRSAPAIMVPPRLNWGWGRSGFGAGRGRRWPNWTSWLRLILTSTG
jgi:hypothetical protein